MVVLGTGFDLKHHAPISDELVRRVQDILNVKEMPSWWAMPDYVYPPPKLWLAMKEEEEREKEEQESGL
ncbi:unnamed protein product [Rhizoctonia solani]|uniref:Uncharacterized protein n=1 Tax=Rhizoctonia solani TaxID=456999 RepID=A0A8H3CFJ9_9AGAM